MGRVLVVVLASLAALAMVGRGTGAVVGDLDPRAHSHRFMAVESGAAVEAEAEAEVEAEASAEAEMEMEAEMEAEAELYADMEAEMEAEAAMSAELSVRLQHRALNEAAARRFTELARWFGWNNAHDAHTGLTTAAVSLFAGVEGDDLTKKLFDVPTLLRGVRWNDMPSGSDAHPSDEPLEEDAGRREYTYHGDHSALVHNVHFGCLQHFHSQCPSVQRPDLQSEFGDDRYVFTNADVRGMILDQLQYWWRTAVEQQEQSGGPTKRATPAKAAAHAAAAATDAASTASTMPAPVSPSKEANFAMGHILATLQDSWTKSHVLRSTEDTPSPSGSELDGDEKGRAMAERCGRVYLFQGADAQEGNTRKPLESAQSSADFYNCAHYYSFIVLKTFARCATAATAADQQRWCPFEGIVKSVLEDNVYPIGENRAAAAAGGSTDEFASPRISRLGYKKLDVDVPAVGAVPIWEPTSGKYWHSLGADDLQVALCHTVRGKVRNFNGVTYRDEAFTDFKNQMRGGRVRDEVTCGVAKPEHAKSGPFWVVSKSGACERHGWRMTRGCGTHHSCRPVKGVGCPGRCLCGTSGACRCVVRLDAVQQKCKGKIKELA